MNLMQCAHTVLSFGGRFGAPAGFYANSDWIDANVRWWLESSLITSSCKFVFSSGIGEYEQIHISVSIDGMGWNKEIKTTISFFFFQFLDRSSSNNKCRHWQYIIIVMLVETKTTLKHMVRLRLYEKYDPTTTPMGLFLSDPSNVSMERPFSRHCMTLSCFSYIGSVTSVKHSRWNLISPLSTIGCLVFSKMTANSSEMLTSGEFGNGMPHTYFGFTPLSCPSKGHLLVTSKKINIVEWGNLKTLVPSLQQIPPHQN